MLGSLLLLALASAAVGRSGLLLLTWTTCAAAATTGAGEAMTLRAAYRFHGPTARQAAALQPAWARALRATGTDADAVELYVQTTPTPNAYAAGRRAVAVTSGVLRDYASGRLPEDLLVAVLVHELGHHATGATRPTLPLLWLTAPWRLTTRVMTALASTLAGRRSGSGRAVVVVAGLAVALTHALQQGHWEVGGVLAFAGMAAVLCRVADAAISRRSEFAADQFAADHDLALELAAALHALENGRSEAYGWSWRLLASHPTPDRRINALLTTVRVVA
jgi:STE24 endopeptidase